MPFFTTVERAGGGVVGAANSGSAKAEDVEDVEDALRANMWQLA